jgi:GNAT superfamily N-acetyltransferase
MPTPEPSYTTTTTPKRPNVAFTLRDVKWGELPGMARIMSLAFWNDQLFGEMIHPNREKYPNDSDLYWLRDARVNFWDRHYKYLVAVTPDTEVPGKEKVIGMAQWERFGEGAKKLDRAWYDPSMSVLSRCTAFTVHLKTLTIHHLGNLMKPLMAKAMVVHELLYPNRAVSPVNKDVIERAYSFFDSIWSGNRAESWYLSFLCVHPDYQGIGVGKKLTLWGIDRAEEEGVVASLITVPGTEDFYHNFGFHEKFGCARDGDGNPLRDLKGLNIVWKWPSRSGENETGKISA